MVKNCFFKDRKMSALEPVISCFSHVFEQLGIYEPQISIEEARKRLELESQLWKQYQRDRNENWNQFLIDQENSRIFLNLLMRISSNSDQEKDSNPPSPLIEEAVAKLASHQINTGVAVDLGCGIGSDACYLLERGWKVYAVDSSPNVISTLTKRITSLGKDWIQNGNLVLVNQTIEEFEFPENVHLVTAIDSLPYCDPTEINSIFLRIKSSLAPQGMLVCNLFPHYNDSRADNEMRNRFGGWMSTKNVVDAVVRSVDFTSSSVTKKDCGSVEQFHIYAYA
jgi:SAM-dependent methyltransferase